MHAHTDTYAIKTARGHDAGAIDVDARVYITVSGESYRRNISITRIR